MVKTVHFHNFFLSEILRFMSRILTICKEKDLVQLSIQPHVTNLETANNKLDAVYKTAQGSELTDLLVNYDRLRDKSIIGIKKSAEAYTYHYNPALRDAAWRIINSINLYGDSISQQNYQTETNSLFEIKSSWTKSSALTSDLEALHLTDWSIEMDRLNTLFSTTENLRVKEEANLPEATATDEKRVVIEAYRKLISQIEARHTISTDGAYLPLINEINVVVQEFNILVDNRGDDDDDITSAGQ